MLKKRWGTLPAQASRFKHQKGEMKKRKATARGVPIMKLLLVGLFLAICTIAIALLKDGTKDYVEKSKPRAFRQMKHVQNVNEATSTFIDQIFGSRKSEREMCAPPSFAFVVTATELDDSREYIVSLRSIMFQNSATFTAHIVIVVDGDAVDIARKAVKLVETRYPVPPCFSTEIVRNPSRRGRFASLEHAVQLLPSSIEWMVHVSCGDTLAFDFAKKTAMAIQENLGADIIQPTLCNSEGGRWRSPSVRVSNHSHQEPQFRNPVYRPSVYAANKGFDASLAVMPFEWLEWDFWNRAVRLAENFHAATMSENDASCEFTFRRQAPSFCDKRKGACRAAITVANGWPFSASALQRAHGVLLRSNKLVSLLCVDPEQDAEHPLQSFFCGVKLEASGAYTDALSKYANTLHLLQDTDESRDALFWQSVRRAVSILRRTGRDTDIPEWCSKLENDSTSTEMMTSLAGCGESKVRCDSLVGELLGDGTCVCLPGKTGVACENDKVVERRENAVFTSAGDRSNVAQWITSASRTYDIIVVYYGSETFAYKDDVDYFYEHKGAKFPNLKWFQESHSDVFGAYDAIMVLDDDIVLEPDGIERLFAIREQHGIGILSPSFAFGALNPDTWLVPPGNNQDPQTVVKYPWLKQRFPHETIRKTSFVEMNVPTFERSVLEQWLVVYDAAAVQAWGVDIWYSDFCVKRSGCEMAVTDRVAAVNPWQRGDGGREIDVFQSKDARERAWISFARKQGLPVTPPDEVGERNKVVPVLMNQNVGTTHEQNLHSRFFENIFIISGKRTTDTDLDKIQTFIGQGPLTVVAATTPDNTQLDIQALRTNDELAVSKLYVQHSHAKVWKQIELMDTSRLQLILEDDIRTDHMDPHTFKRILTHTMENVPDDANLVMLGRCWDRWDPSMVVNDVIVRPKGPMCRHAYAINSLTAKKLLQSAWPMSEPGDHVFRKVKFDGAYAPMCSILEQDRVRYASANDNSHMVTTFSDPHKNMCPYWNRMQTPDPENFECDMASDAQPSCADAAYTQFNVVIPFFNYNHTTLTNAVMSIVHNHYPRDRVRIWLFDDGSTSPETIVSYHYMCDNVVSTSDTLPRSGFINCIRSERNGGPAYSKYTLFRMLHRHVHMNSVIVVLDGDDVMHNPNALSIINQQYLKHSVWTTYGNYKGPYSERTSPIPFTSTGDDISPVTPRLEKPITEWRYGHPRTFKAHLLKHMDERLFKQGNEWLQKATDRAFYYRVLELSGYERIGYIGEELYTYIVHDHSSVHLTSNEVKSSNLRSVMLTPAVEPLIEPIHVLLVVWKRIMFLKSQLRSISAQKTHRPIHLHIINNNQDTTTQSIIDGTVNEFVRQKVRPSMHVSVRHMPENRHAYARFMYATELFEHEHLDEIVFVDDDQEWGADYIQTLVNEYHSYDPRPGMVTWYGKQFTQQNDGVADYWFSSPDMDDIRRRRCSERDLFTYGGPGGSIFNANLFWVDGLRRLDRDLSLYYEFDDVWISYLLNHVLGWDIRRTMLAQPKELALVRSKHDEAVRVGTWDSKKTEKNAFFEFLQTDMNWSIDTVSNCRGGSTVTNHLNIHASVAPTPKRIQNPMRVCLVSLGLRGMVSRGGIGSMFYRYMQLYRDSGHQVSLLFPNFSNEQSNEVEEEYRRQFNVPFHTFQRGVDDTRKYYGTYQMQMSYRIMYWLLQREHEFDVVVFHDYRGIAMATIHMKRTGDAFQHTRLVVTAHSSSRASNYHNARVTSSNDLVTYSMEDFTRTFADICIFPSKFFQDYSREHSQYEPRGNTVVIPNFMYGTNGISGARKLQRRSAMTKLAFFGRVDTLKGVNVLTGAYEEMLASPEQLRPTGIAWIGDTNAKRKTVNEHIADINQHMKREGVQVVQHKDMNTYAALSLMREEGYVAIVPSLYENYPLSLLECLYSGIPVIYSDAGGMPEVAFQNEYMFRSGNATDLNRVIQRVLGHGMKPNKPKNNQRVVMDQFLRATLKRHEPGPDPGPTNVAPDCGDVTVGIVTRGRNDMVRTLLNTHLEAQTCRGFRVIVFDNNAQRGLVIPDQHTILRGNNVPVGVARNRIINATKTPRLLLFDDDDIPHPDMLEKMTTTMTRTGADLVTCSCNNIGTNDNVHHISLPVGSTGLATNFVIHHSGKANVMIRTEAALRAGGCVTERGRQVRTPFVDWGLYTTMMLDGSILAVYPLPLYDYRMHSRGSLYYSAGHAEKFFAQEKLTHEYCRRYSLPREMCDLLWFARQNLAAPI
jgi:glycosyltransferase involved in cell wall biosynthesis